MSQVFLIACSLIWSFAYFVAKDLSPFAPPDTIVFYRYLLSATLLLPIVLRRQTFTREVVAQGVLCGVFLGLLTLTIHFGILFGTVANAGFIVSLFVLFVPLINLIFNKAFPSKRHFLAILIAMSGLWILTGGIHALNTGDTFYLMSAIICAFHITLVERALKTGIAVIPFVFTQYITAALLSVSLAVMRGSSLTIPLGKGLADLLYLGVAASGFATLFQTLGQKKVSSLRACIIFTSEPLLTALFAWLLAGELLSTSFFLGAALILASILLSEFSKSDMKGGNSPII